VSLLQRNKNLSSSCERREGSGGIDEGNNVTLAQNACQLRDRRGRSVEVNDKKSENIRKTSVNATSMMPTLNAYFQCSGRVLRKIRLRH